MKQNNLVLFYFLEINMEVLPNPTPHLKSLVGITFKLFKTLKSNSVGNGAKNLPKTSS